MEAYRLLPTNIDTNIWLGIYYVKQNIYEKACNYLERASQLQPKEVKWRLMVASCQRRIGNFRKALKIYESIYQEYPENVECVRFLVLLCKDMGLDYEEYARQLKQLELENEARAGYGDGQVFSEVENQPEQNERPLNIPVGDKKGGRRDNQQPVAKKQPANNADDDWGSGMENMLNV